ncbi:MAG TPA: lipase maturation factor family protein [Myxococcota bacterium]|nr:lipase maturation factor family protein [Myxococcota bacterium]
MDEIDAIRAEGPLRRLFGPHLPARGSGHLWARWIFLRALGAVFFSAFYSLAFQIHGLMGPHGILPAGEYLATVARELGLLQGLWYAPSLLWLGAGDWSLTFLVAAGLAASVLLFLNVWPRATIAACGVLFLSFVSAAQDFSSYQSDGMLLEAALISLFLAPRGLRPGFGEAYPPSWAARFMLVWEWFRIYFESGVVKLATGDPQWRALTAMDHYYENGPLPTWIGWYVQQLPHWFHAVTAFLVLALELAVCWLAFLPRRARLVCFGVVTPFQVGIILTANYTFLNYLVLFLGVLLVDDRAFAALAPLARRVPARARAFFAPRAAPAPAPVATWRVAAAAFVLVWVFYATVLEFPALPAPPGPLAAPAVALEPFRVANPYHLFGSMTEARYEIEFQGSRDGAHWLAYPFRYKPQDPAKPPGLYAPYQPRFEWNLWFASLDAWEENPWVVRTEALLLERSPAVMRLFAGDPFAGGPPPRYVRSVNWLYRFTDLATKRTTGLWWAREDLGPFAPALERKPDGTIAAMPDE